MACFPLFTDIKNKKCVIVGGGKVALRKAETLLRYQADVRVIGQEVCGEIKRILPQQSWTEQKLENIHKYLSDAFLVVAATSDRDMNHCVACYCAQNHIPVNVIDEPKECTFIFPAVVLKGDISIGINTGAKSPIVSRRIREQIEEVIPDYYADIADQLGELRTYGKKHFKEEVKRRNFLKYVAHEAFLCGRPLTDEEIKKCELKVVSQ